MPRGCVISFPGKPAVVVMPPPPLFRLSWRRMTRVKASSLSAVKTAQQPCRAGLDRIPPEVWPQVIAALPPDARLRVYGTVDTREIAVAAGVEVRGPVPDLSQAYAENAVGRGAASLWLGAEDQAP